MKLGTKADFVNKKIVMNYNRILLWLSLLLIVSMYLVIRGSSWSLLFDNKVFRVIFYTDINADHTLYNIAISYIAAYIFYLIQVFIPEKRRTDVALLSTKLDMLNCLHQCAIFLEGWKAYTIRDSQNGTITGTKIDLLYYEDLEGHIVQITPKSLSDTVSRILEQYDKVKENIDFQNADISLQKLFRDMDFAEQANGMLQVFISARILENIPDSTIMETYSEKDLIEFQLRIMKLAMIYNVENVLVLNKTTNKEKIMAYHKIMGQENQVVMENQEYFAKLSENYGKSVREVFCSK
jgi:hypothetical protein